MCDQGTEFMSNIFKDFCEQYKIDLHYTSVQQSTSNSPVERLHSTITEIYRIIMNKRKTLKLDIDHDEILYESFITYNNSIHSSTKLSPYELFFGKPHSFLEHQNFKNEHDYLEKLNEFQEKLYPTIKEHILKSKTKLIDKLNKSRHEPEIREENEEIFRKENRRNKLTPRFSKRKVLVDNGVTLQTTENKKIHKSKMKLRKRK